MTDCTLSAVAPDGDAARALAVDQHELGCLRRLRLGGTARRADDELEAHSDLGVGDRIVVLQAAIDICSPLFGGQRRREAVLHLERDQAQRRG